MRFWLFIGVLSLTLTSLLAQDRGMGVRAAQDAGLTTYDPARMHALVIGINRYKNWASLRSAVPDAQAVAETLRTRYGYTNVKLLLDEEATRVNILKALDGYMRLGKSDSLLIYYAGHGYMDEYKNGFWVPPDAPRDSKYEYLANSQVVNDYFKKYQVRHLLVVADSCFSGSLLRGGEVKREKDWKLPAGYEKPSRWVMTSGDLAPVEDDAGTGHSPFAVRFLQYLEAGDLEAFGIQDLYVWLRRYMERQVPLCQALDTPNHMPGGEFIFCRVTRTAPVAPVIVPSPAPASSVQGPVREIRTGTLVVKSPERGQVRVGNGAATAIEPSERLRWEKLAVGKYPVTVTADGVTWTGEADVREGQVCEVEAVFRRGPKQGEPLTVDLGGGEKLEMVWIEPGSFMMGSPAGESDRDNDETQHRVTLSKGFWMGKYEVTQGQWERVMGNNPAKFKGARNPVEQVSWDDCQEFVRKLNGVQGSAVQGSRFRLPTEAEWEYACRAGTTGAYAGSLDELAWYGESWERGHHPVGQKKANAWGLYDMHGNVWEWCQDWYGDYPTGSVTDPTGPGSGSYRVRRGGSWIDSAGNCRSAYRIRFIPGDRSFILGLRLVRSPHEP